MKFWEGYHSQIALLRLIAEHLKIFGDFDQMRYISALGFSSEIFPLLSAVAEQLIETGHFHIDLYYFSCSKILTQDQGLIVFDSLCILPK